MTMPVSKLMFVVTLVISTTICQSAMAQRDSFGGAPIHYLTAEVHDPVARLQAKLDSNELRLTFDNQQGYLKAVLKALDIPLSSQTLVFSKTSLQLNRISPRMPRALYFNDDVYVGWCQRGDVLELAATDAKQGAMFYTIEQSESEAPRFVRDKGQCLSCHASSRTQNVPGYLVRSVYSDGSGHPVFGSGTFTTSDRSPFEERWGGWYVTGTHGSMRHMGNALYRKETDDLDREIYANQTSLKELVRTEPYLTPHSDIVALMVLEHQTQMHNAIAAANYETRQATYQSHQMNDVLDRPAGFLSDTSKRRISRSADNLLEHLLFCDEFTLNDSVSGTSNFQSEFEARGPVDPSGRSLRQFDLNRRLFAYPCSYLIYSDAFLGLPNLVRSKVLGRLKFVLTSDVSLPKFAHLSSIDKDAVHSILMATLPEYQTAKQEAVTAER